jgi:hypothetical protein
MQIRHVVEHAALRARRSVQFILVVFLLKEFGDAESAGTQVHKVGRSSFLWLYRIEQG